MPKNSNWPRMYCFICMAFALLAFVEYSFKAVATISLAIDSFSGSFAVVAFRSAVFLGVGESRCDLLFLIFGIV